MASAVQKIVLSSARDIPFNRLVLSQSNVRRTKAGVSIEELAEDIARRTLLQSLNVRPVLDAQGAETGMFEVPAGGRRYRALEFLVKQKRLAKTAPVPCVVREAGIAEEDSLAENVHREPLHPLDQFRAFKDLIEKGLTEEEIAARFFVSVNIVKQRLKLTTVSPKLLDVYAADGMSLDQLTAFSVSNDHARQEQVWESISRSHIKEPYYIRRLLTESAIPLSDRRAQFVGVEAYEAAGGGVMRDLFSEDHGGWLQDPALLERLVDEKLKAEAETIAKEGWKWVSAAVDFQYGYKTRLRRLMGEPIEISEEEKAALRALQAEYDELNAQYDGADELPDDADERLSELETAIARLEERPLRFDPEHVTRAGVFVSVDEDGELEIERGFVRPEDEPEQAANAEARGETVQERVVDRSRSGAPNDVQRPASIGAEAEEDDELRPLSDRLLTELTAHRTLALRDAVAGDFVSAFIAVLHVLALNAFYRFDANSCLEISVKSATFGAQAPGLKNSSSAKAIESRHEQWRRHLPAKSEDLWAALIGFDGDSRQALFAHCASLAINAVREPWSRSKERLAHADALATAVNLDMAVAGWKPTIDNYLGRVSKVRILDAVREGKGERDAQLIDHLKKNDMAAEAERLLADSGWLPELLRTKCDVEAPPARDAGDALPAFLTESSDGLDADKEASPEHLAAAE